MSKSSSGVTPNSVEILYSIPIISSSSKDFEESIQLSLPPGENEKVALHKEGIYNTGSGEICAKYIPMSDSTVERHVYYAYPRIKDPGIMEALLNPEPRKMHPLDGQDLYLDLCEEMKLPQVRSFLRGLLEEAIDLKYYGVNPNSVRAMSLALTYNRNVKRLDLTSNFLNEDACYHLGQMFQDNFALQELILSGCRIQSEGLRKLVVFFSHRSIEELDLSRNDIGDNGFEYLAREIVKGAVIKRNMNKELKTLIYKNYNVIIYGLRLNLSYNDLTSASAALLAMAIECNNTITHLNLSWNKMSSLKEVNELLDQLGDNKVLVELNMSWNSLKVNRILKKILSVTTLRILDLSNNRLGKLAAVVLANNLQTAKSLHTLDLSFNPIPTDGAYILVSKLRNKTIKLINLFMNNVEMNKKFVTECKEVLQLSYRKKAKITYGFVKHDYTLSMPDIREIILKRMDYLTSRASKKGHLDIAIYFLQKKKACDFVQPREFMRDMKIAGTPLGEDLVVGLTDIFPGPKLDKGGKTMDLAGVIEMIHRMWPEKKLPPTPEPKKEIPSEKG